MSGRARAALADAQPSVFWLDDPDRPAPLPALSGPVEADLVVVGGGYAGLWTALRAVERDPSRSVVVLEAGTCGNEASGRNGGFASASLTHGFGNGLARWPAELATLDRLGAANLRGIADTVRRYGIDCHWEETGELMVASAPHQLAELEELAGAMSTAGHDVELLDGPGVRARLDSPSYVGGLADPHGTALVEPARLAWGLRQACLGLGVRIFEGSPVTGVAVDGVGLVVTTARGSVRAGRVALATNAFPPLLRRLRLMTVPVYDHVLMTEPLSPSQLAAIGWAGREGVGDCANQFHYFRLTRDNRILWGGYDAVYHYGSRIARDLEQSDRTHRMLAEQFFAAFPQLDGLRFTHRWGGVIDTCTRFAAFYGTAHGGRTAYALGYTG
ncbi:MAG: FAD-dependent oxidoreductase, partial [Nocardioides sp.]|nr:FAD-dependent oxidoreductase [Nocardioides sp.]